jgi:hypothetical protein
MSKSILKTEFEGTELSREWTVDLESRHVSVDLHHKVFHLLTFYSLFALLLPISTSILRWF